MTFMLKRKLDRFLKHLQSLSVYKIQMYLFLKKNRKDQFTLIYKAGGFGDSPSLSGSGSSMESTESIRSELPGLIAKYKINSILDIPCGDVYWMRHVNLGNIQYTGGDIVDDLIAANQKNFGNSNRIFKVIDLVTDDLPCADLVLCRDCFIHLKFKDILAALNNIKKSGSTYLLVSTYLQCAEYLELGTDFWRPLNLQLQPFSLSEPLEIIKDKPCANNEKPDKCLALYRIKDLPNPY